MRYLVLSDIHANLAALEAVLAAAGRGWDELLVLGDLVGYAAEPNEVIERVRALHPRAIIRGNHDKVGSGLEAPDGFNAVARRAITWTYEHLTPENREYLAALPSGPIAVDDEVEICHGAPFDEDVYIFDDLGAVQALRSMHAPLCLFGHTHVPACYRLAGGHFESVPLLPDASQVVRWERGVHTLVNCGSVGQPRDGDARAAYGIIDTAARQVRCCRVEYDIEQTQGRIAASGLPDMLAVRLGVGR